MAFYDISRGGLHLPGTAKTNLTGSVATVFRPPGKVTGLVNLQSAPQRISSQDLEFSFIFRQLGFRRAIPLGRPAPQVKAMSADVPAPAYQPPPRSQVVKSNRRQML